MQLNAYTIAKQLFTRCSHVNIHGGSFWEAAISWSKVAQPSCASVCRALPDV